MKKNILLFVFLTFCFSIVNAQTTRYVKQGGVGDGSSWANASGNLQNIINISASGDSVFVAQGTYTPQWTAAGYNIDTVNDANSVYPSVSDGENNSFVMKKGVLIYGGFPNTGNPVFSDRNWETYTTILDGNNACYHVIIASTKVDGATLDGFTIQRGKANGTNTSYYVNGQLVSRVSGAGFYSLRANITCKNLKIINNHANNQGGGLFMYQGAPIFENIIVTNNSAVENGGGIYGHQQPKIRNAIIKNNTAKIGGAIYVDVGVIGTSYQLELTNAIVSGNFASQEGGAFYVASRGQISLTNVTVAGNKATTKGGAISLFVGGPNGGSASATNSIIWGNTASNDPNVTFCSYTRCLVEKEDAANAWPASEYRNPLFIAPVSASSAPNSNGDYRVQQLSPAINCADSTVFKSRMGISGNADWTDIKDMNGAPRLVYKDLDLGAFDMQDPIKPDTLGIVFVKTNGSGTLNGSSWANSYPNFTNLLNYATYHNYMCTPVDSVKQIWVTEGTWLPAYRLGNGDNDRDKAFVLPEGVQIYGGFRPNANDLQDTTPKTRGNVFNYTVLSGNLGASNYSYHVVVGTNIFDNKRVVLDGFKIKDGKANGSGTVTYKNQAIPRNNGGGICLVNSSNTSSRYSDFDNLIIENNIALNNGGGVYNEKCQTSFKNVFVRGNASSIGAGIYNMSVTYPKIIQSVISGNKADANAGGVYNNSSSTIILNTTIGGNNFHGMFNLNSNPIIKNSIIWGNSQNITNQTSTPQYSYNLVQGSGGSSSWNTAYGTNLGHNVDVNPKYVNWINPTGTGWSNTTNGNYSIKGTSPAINAGSNYLYSTELNIPNLNSSFDITGGPRLILDSIDLGAFEILVFNVNFAGINVNIPSQIVALNDHVELPTAPTRTGFYFAGWFTDNNTFLNQWNFSTYVITSDTTLYVKWVEHIVYEVSFAGEEINIPPQYVDENNFAVEPTQPTRQNYIFGGWFTDNSTFTNQWIFTTNPVVSNITLYAKWQTTISLSDNFEEQISLFPNPASDILNISGIKNNSEITIFDLSGRIIQISTIDGDNSINVKNLFPGLYLIKIQNRVLRFVKQ
ncbi:MAG: InlB B-repeat-containing protein [Bacteroidales bacterium]|nr:InlB B-repeat-containing protein [Bacteroidales bacterium]